MLENSAKTAGRLFVWKVFLLVGFIFFTYLSSVYAEAATGSSSQRNVKTEKSKVKGEKKNQSKTQEELVEEQENREEDFRRKQETNWKATVVRGKRTRIKELTFVEYDVPVFLVPRTGALRPSVELFGHYRRKGWKLYTQGFPLLGRMVDPSAFRFFSVLKSPTNHLTLVARGPKGQMEQEQVLLVSPEAKEFRISSPWGEAVFSLGVANNRYFQTGFGLFQGVPLMAELHYHSPEWKFPIRLYTEIKSTLFMLGSNPPELNPQTLLCKLDAVYRFKGALANRFRFHALLGGIYLTMITNGSPFGFSNLLAPEIGVRIDYPYSLFSRISGKVTYSPLAGLVDFSQRGIDLRLTWSTVLPNAHRFEVSGFLSNHFFFNAGVDTEVQSNLLGFLVGYSI